jgi:hypothetical protein
MKPRTLLLSVMKRLLDGLPFWLERFETASRPGSGEGGREKQEGDHGRP